MKPSQPNVEYCIEHKDWINGLLEKRGWQVGDWCERRLSCGPTVVSEVKDGEPYFVETVGRGRGTFFHMGHWDIIWLPSEGDVLAMLETIGIESVVVFKASVSEGYFAGYSRPTEPTYYGLTRLIALLELVRAVEERG